MADNLEEWFDVVDETDRVTGRAQRGDVHALGLLHRAVHILVQRVDGAVFLQQRSMSKDCHPGKWDSSASGHLDAGEAYDAAAVRELREELGICLGSLTHIGSLAATERTGWEFVRIYSVRHDGPFTLHPEEVADGRWVKPLEIDRWLHDDPSDFAPCFHDVWKVFQTKHDEA